MKDLRAVETPNGNWTVVECVSNLFWWCPRVAVHDSGQEMEPTFGFEATQAVEAAYQCHGMPRLWRSRADAEAFIASQAE